MWDLSSPAFLLAWPQQESDCAFFKKHPFWVIVAFSTIPPLRQFPLAEKTESPWNAFQEPDSWVPSRLW